MKRIFLLLVLLLALTACFALSAAAETGTATFMNGDSVAASVPRNHDGSFMLPAAPDTGARQFVCWVLKDESGKESLHMAGSVFGGEPTGNLRFEALTVEMHTAPGAAVSYTAPNLMRFDGGIRLSDHQRLLSLAGVGNVSLGVLIAPYRSCDGKTISHAEELKGVMDRVSADFLYTNDVWGVFSGCTDEIPDSALLEKYCARAYLTVRIGGHVVTVYADHDEQNNTRSVYGVNAAAFMDRAGSANAAHPHQTDAGCFSRYDGAQLSHLRARLNKVVYVSVMDEGSIQSKYSLDNYTFFTFECKDEDGNAIHSLYTSPYKVDRMIANSPAGYDTYVVTGQNGADFHTVTAYFVGGSYRAPDPAEWKEDGIYISVEQPVS